MKKVYGYCRISRAKQSIERQIRNIKEIYPEAIIIEEAHTRTNFERKQWKKLINIIQEGDTIVFDSVSRMSGNEEEGFQAYEELFQKGVELIFIKEPHINTQTYKTVIENSIQLTGTNIDFILEGVNKYLLALAKEQIKLAFQQSEKEVMDLRQRTIEGIETARLNGKQIGSIKGKSKTTKKSITAKEIIKKHSKSFDGSLDDDEVLKLAEISRKTYYKYKKELKEEL